MEGQRTASQLLDELVRDVKSFEDYEKHKHKNPYALYFDTKNVAVRDVIKMVLTNKEQVFITMEDDSIECRCSFCNTVDAISISVYVNNKICDGCFNRYLDTYSFFGMLFGGAFEGQELLDRLKPLIKRYEQST